MCQHQIESTSAHRSKNTSPHRSKITSSGLEGVTGLIVLLCGRGSGEGLAPRCTEELTCLNRYRS